MNTKQKKIQPSFDPAQRLEALMKALPVGITFSTDTTCGYITGNPYILKKLEMINGDNISTSHLNDNLAGTKLRHFINGIEIGSSDMPMQRAIAENKQIGPLEIEVELPSGKRWLMEATGAPIHDEKGRVVASVAVNMDITERKRAEAVDKLERHIEQEKQKIDFIADATHELRTPLAIIKGNVDLALRGGVFDAASIQETLHAIDSEVVHLDKLLYDLTLLTTKDSDSQRKLTPHPIEARDLITRIVKRHQAFAKKKGIVIHMDPLPEVCLAGDERYLERLFSNIIANAISYGKEDGTVHIRGKVTGGRIRIEIEDNGMGIAAEDLPLIFNRFYRTEKSRSKDTGGTGLGLAIVKWIAEAHGGAVTVTSKEGKGSVFAVTLPSSPSL